MKERIVYLNGEYIPESEAKISIFDRGFVHGDAAFDIARTFNHKPFKLRAHLDRLYRSLSYLRIDPGMTEDKMEEITIKVLEENLPLIGENDDYRLIQRVSRGSDLIGDILNVTPPTVIIHCLPIPFARFARYYETGIHLVTPFIRRPPPQCLDSRAKTQNRINNILADIEAKQANPECYSLILDLNGNVAENSVANFFAVLQGKLATPRWEHCLAGITRGTIIELAGKVGIPVIEEDLTIYDVYNADEAFLSGTTATILPVAKVNGKKLNESPGPISKMLTQKWSEMVGVDIVAQAKGHLS